MNREATLHSVSTFDANCFPAFFIIFYRQNIICQALFFFQRLKGYFLRHLPPLKRRKKTLPEIIKQAENHLALGVNEEQGNQNVNCTQNVRKRPQKNT